MLSNLDIRTAAKEKGVRLWEVAGALKISEPTFTRKLRHELPQEEKTAIYAIIDNIAESHATAESNAPVKCAV